VVGLIPLFGYPITGTSRTHSPSSGTGIRLLPMTAPAREEGNAEERPTDLTERLVAISAQSSMVSQRSSKSSGVVGSTVAPYMVMWMMCTPPWCSLSRRSKLSREQAQEGEPQDRRWVAVRPSWRG